MPKSISPKAERLKALIDFDKRLYFLVLVLLFILIRYLTNALIIESIPDSENLDAKGELMIFHVFNTLDYIWTPFALLLKFTVIAFLFWVGGFFLGYKLSFKELWQFALVAEFVFLFPELIRFLVFIGTNSNVTFTEIMEYRPFSLLALFGPENLEDRYHYAFGTLNLFELAYGYIWVLGFHAISNRPLRESIFAVLLSYFLPLAIWLSWYIIVYRS
ncbi:sulfate ABC transporter permease [Algoriphagus sp. CAU 1675]|uniref:sulfate ABC transporter permease n=1 Tax=Algoriphagus sp. CAU 1675 TaxID=3032597 RepID=UPI0023DA713E|nr:sulfate ABC transporter permease [Algoriphagus sp. CAU 1675]MDF2158211.1 sulfate ABC transporter permease [Algoriphagus sp. CAU 1675]